jgi:methionyl-tRNA formyltransferase
MKIIFFGSDDFAAAHLRALLDSKQQLLAVVTQPDRAKGRGLQVEPSLVKTMAVAAKLAVLQPENLKDKSFVEQVKGYSCDLFVVIAYGRILPSELLQVPYAGAINVHGSLLPKYRGAAPINWAIINGDSETGISIIKMNAAMDAGDVISQAKIKIEDSDTAVTLRAKMAEAGKALLLKTIDSLEKKTSTLTVQDSRAVTLAPKLTKELGKIDWQKPAQEIHDLVRGLLPWPAAYTHYQGKMLKILETGIAETAKKGKPGEVVEAGKEVLIVTTGRGALALKKVQPESAKAMDIKSFAAGHKITPGFQFT